MKKWLYFFLILGFPFTACQDFEELNEDPNRPVAAPASLLLNGVLYNLYESSWSKEHRWNQYYCINYNYYGNNEYDWTTGNFDFFTLKNVVKMEEEAQKAGSSNVYSAMGKFLRAYFAVRMTMKFGDIPFSQALLGTENTTPAYDSQKAVFQAALKLLDEANRDIADLIKSGIRTVEGDFYFNGDLNKWQKVVNTFRLRVLIHLSKKENDNDLNVKASFAQVFNNPGLYPVMTAMEDNLKFQHIAGINNYPKNPGNQGFDSRRYNMSATYLNTLVALKDPRTFIVADPAEARIDAGMSPNDFNAYIGADSGESLDDMTFKAGNGEYSFINQVRYYSTFGGPEPDIQIGYPELCFNIAEAINRGWVTGNAAEWYEKGIRASMGFYGIIDAAALSAYLEQPAVAYKGNNADGLNQILLQRYLALFQHSGLESFYHWRRTGVPAFLTGVGTGNGGQIPLRWQYPANERTANAASYNDALNRQFGGQDDVNAKIWLLQ